MSSSARGVVLDVLIAIDRDDAYANLLLPERIKQAELNSQDAAFATECCYGTARFTGLYDWIISQVAGRPAAKLDVLPRCALRLGAHQLLQMRVQHHAAVNETVDLVKRRGHRGIAGFVNANLRAIGEHTLSEWLDLLKDSFGSELAVTAMSNAHAQWIAKSFLMSLAREGRESELGDLLAADNVAPPVQLVALPGVAERAAVVAAHPDRCEVLAAAPQAMQLRGGSPSDLPEVRTGTVRVQDAGSQLAALALAHAPVATASETKGHSANERWFDLCAGPGGKSALLAALALQRGASFAANEVVPARAGLVRRALEPLGNFEVSERDGRDIGSEFPQQFDRILADVPCSGLGALRRRPEARWRKSKSDLDTLVPLQRELLASAVHACKIGGVVAYVTCSPAVEETTQIVSDVLDQGGVVCLDTAAAIRAAGSEIELTPVSIGDSNQTDAEVAGNAVQLWPHVHGTDAMFICLLRRIA